MGLELFSKLSDGAWTTARSQTGTLGCRGQGNELGVLGDDPDLRFHLLVDDVGSTLSSTSAASPVVPADNMDTVVVARVDAQPCEVRVSGLRRQWVATVSAS